MNKDILKKNLRKSNILFVDDEEFVVQTMKDILPILFNKAHFALNGFDAIDIVEKNHIDIIITDLSMPKMDGIKMLKKIKEQKPRIKTICVSGHNEKEYLNEAKKLGSSFIIKPISSFELYSALEKVI
jgi:two-component system response regulator YesN